MPSAKRILSLEFSPSQVSIGLLLLRLVVAGTLFIKHGHEKLIYFGAMKHSFPDPIGVGSFPSFMVALLSDSICSVLMILGLGTRWAAAFAFFNLFVAWDAAHHFMFFGQDADHGEMIVLYLGAFLCLFFAGPGRFSLDELLFRSRVDESRRHV